MTKTPENFPIVEGRYQMTKSWSIELPEAYRRRFAEGNLALWRDGMTHWIAVWTIPSPSTTESTFDWIKNDRPEALIDEFEPVRPGYRCWGFLVEEKTAQGNRWALYSYTVGRQAYVQMATYIDERIDLDKALRVWGSLEETEIK